MPCYSIDGLIPVVDPSAYVHPSAVLIGDVIIGADCYVGPLASMRGDFGRLILERGANLQDTCVMHGFPGTETVVKENGHIGHGAILHGCVIGDNALVGMNAVIMDGAKIGAESIVAAGSFVKAAFKCDARSMLIGSPAKVIREVTDEEVQWKSKGTQEYQQLTLRSMNTQVEVEPLRSVEPGRPTMSLEGVVEPLYSHKNSDTI